jgi:hypothetical protein
LAAAARAGCAKRETGIDQFDERVGNGLGVRRNIHPPESDLRPLMRVHVILSIV